MEQAGTLMVRVYVSQAQIPIEGAAVVVTGEGTNGKRILHSVQVTDRSGQIKPVRIETPGVEESTSPEGVGGGAPFALCTVWAEREGYALLQVDGVQIFPGVESVQEMELIPLEAGESSLGNRTVRGGSVQNL